MYIDSTSLPLPFSARPTSGIFSHVVIWGVSLLTGIVLALLILPEVNAGPGTCMYAL